MLITVAVFINVLEANIAKGALESEGIFAFIPNENTNQAYGQLLGDTKLQVLQEDVEEARRILSNNHE